MTQVRKMQEKPSPAAKAMRSTRERVKPSHWLWVPFVWFLTVTTRSVQTWLAGGSLDKAASDLADVSGSPVDRAVLVVLIVLSLIALVLRAERTKRVLTKNKWLLLLFAYIGVTILWSNFPDISLRRFMRAAGMFASVLVVLTEADPIEAILTLLRRTYLLCIPLSILTIKYFRTVGVAYDWSGQEEMWVGLTMHKNNLGQVAMCSGLFSLWQVLRRWPQKKLTADLLLFFCTLWILRGSKNSHSSTAIVGFLVGTAFLLCLQLVKRRPRHARKFVILAVVSLLVITPLVYVSMETLGTTPLGFLLSATGRDMTFTGRTGLWQDILNNAKKSPIVGVGYGAFWVGHIGYDRYPLENWSLKTPGWRPNEGHNGYLDVYIDDGVIGVGLLLVVVLIAFNGALKDLQYRFDLGTLRLTFLLAIVLNNMTESSFLKGTHSLWFVFLVMAVNLPMLVPRKRLEKSLPTREEVQQKPVIAAAPARRVRAWTLTNDR